MSHIGETLPIWIINNNIFKEESEITYWICEVDVFVPFLIVCWIQILLL